MTDGREFELKYCVDAPRAAAVASALEAAGATRQRLESRYFDTVDGRLASQRLTLRLRHSPAGWEQTLKAPGPTPRDRHEDTQEAPRAARLAAVPDVEPSLHADSSAGRLLSRLLRRGDSSPPPLSERYSTVVLRLAVEIANGDSRIEVAFDRGSILAGDASQPICEVEYEVTHGDRRLALAVARRGIVDHGLWLETRAKSERGEQLALDQPSPPRKAGACRLDTDMDGREIARSVLGAALEQIAGNASVLAARGNANDDDIVHQLRVGLRRARTAARELAGLEPALAGPWQAAATQAFRLLGETRDRNVVARQLEAELAAAGSPAPALVTEADAADIDPAAIVRDPGFQLALVDLIEIVDAPAFAPTETALPAKQAHAFIAKRLERLHRHVSGAGRKFPELEEDDQHRVRKALKRLRYLSEAVRALFRKRAVQRFLDHLGPAQDVLGEHVDLLAGRRWAEAQVGVDASSVAFNLAWFDARLGISGDACAKALRRIAHARPFWT